MSRNIAMKLTKLIYTSSMSDKCNLNEIDNILTEAIQRNTSTNITGVLYYSNRYFFQCLEGENKDVEEVFALIEKDKRHTNIMIVEKAPIATRQFGEWAMAYILQSPLLIPIHQRLMSSTEFDPRLMTPDNANLLLEELKNYLPKAYLATLQELS
ncbi:BLUF domain-containing protein [Vibrio cholerae]|nr:BLUF domain-containing protein [Vibrio cholerae]QHQ92482.1 BLUF domain-containing protein [Vibrio cholerae O1]RNE76277.1 BLUF domain-containing protein [Vibrio cholerae]TQP09660.1 BLUF domain-containing protein [Vibrio cholerae]TQP28246.1 BLUF domain-containing protein [Vibrio cholerae]